MDNVVSLVSDRPRPRRPADAPQDSARILFFTGVRYCRADEDPNRHDAIGDVAAALAAASERPVDAAAH